jgi:D-serine dehydratase
MNPSAPPFGPHLKGFPAGGAPLAREQIALQDWQLLRGDLALPLAVLKRSALEHNLHWMRDFCAQRGLYLAPHGKTSMSPELWQMQPPGPGHRFRHRSRRRWARATACRCC